MCEQRLSLPSLCNTTLISSVADPGRYSTDPDPADEKKRIRIQVTEEKPDPDPDEIVHSFNEK